MAGPSGIVTFGKLKEIAEFENIDERTGQKRKSLSYRVAVQFDDENSSVIAIYLPRDTRAPDLEVGKSYGFPTIIRPKKDGKGVSYTARADVQPFPA